MEIKSSEDGKRVPNHHPNNSNSSKVKVQCTMLPFYSSPLMLYSLLLHLLKIRSLEHISPKITMYFVQIKYAISIMLKQAVKDSIIHLLQSLISHETSEYKRVGIFPG